MIAALHLRAAWSTALDAWLAAEPGRRDLEAVARAAHRAWLTAYEALPWAERCEVDRQVEARS